MAKMVRKTLKQLTAAVDGWNEKHPVGTKVMVRLDSGESIKSETTSAAWVIGGHSALVKLQGITGGYALERVTAVN